MNELPFSQACENNKQVILEILERYLKDGDQVLELAGGTGQHCVHFAANLPNLHWQSSDIPSNLDNLNLRLAHAKLANLPEAIAIDVNHPFWNSTVLLKQFSALTAYTLCLPILLRISSREQGKFYKPMEH